MRARHAVQELRELGLHGTLFRVAWELRMRSGWMARQRPPLDLNAETAARCRQNLPARLRALPFEEPAAVAEAMGSRAGEAPERLAELARDAARGRILCFGRWPADWGDPVDWHLHPSTGKSFDPGLHWSKALAEQPRVGDVKITWEIARFPHAYQMARAATFRPVLARELKAALAGQLRGFLRENPMPYGVHWNSGQEIAFRLMAWAFALRTLRLCDDMEPAQLDELVLHWVRCATHIEAHVDYARIAVHNNHVLSEAIGLLLAGFLLQGHPAAKRWVGLGRELLDESVARQFSADGGYIQQSHNYERVALQDLLWGVGLVRALGEAAPESWREALARSLHFLLAQQNAPDGRLPNYGANDGALPSVLSCCDHSDFRPTLQAVSVAAHGQRLSYGDGPWDEEAVWLHGAGSLELPARDPTRTSVSFADTGFHVLRGRDASSFAVLRCGRLRDRFSQIDMLHLDVFWRGLNVLVDAGSFLYNGPPEWHAHFTRTACHNTLTVDAHDQMLFHRQFKNLYWTDARLLHFEDEPDRALCAGEHYGFQRHPGRCVHRRSVLYLKDDTWVVVDHVTGGGSHDVRLHWLGGEFEHGYDRERGTLRLETPRGPFRVAILDAGGAPIAGDVVSGDEKEPRGWSSRYYGEKVPVPSLAVRARSALPLTFVSILSGQEAESSVSDGKWSVRAGPRHATFQLVDGRIQSVEAGRSDGGLP